MLINLTAVALVAAAWVMRAESPAFSIVGLEAVAVACLAVGGWMGGILVSRNQISVDHRYASAGRWKESTIEARPGEAIAVAEADELKVNQMKLLRIGDRRIVLARSEDGYLAFDDRCPHRGGSRAGGTMICATVQCPWHGSQFDARTGAVKAGPAQHTIAGYRVEDRNGTIYVTS